MIKNIKKEFNYIYWLTRSRYGQFNIYLNILISLIFFHIPGVSFDLKIKYLSPKAIPLLKKDTEYIFVVYSTNKVRRNGISNLINVKT